MQAEPISGQGRRLLADPIVERRSCRWNGGGVEVLHRAAGPSQEGFLSSTRHAFFGLIEIGGAGCEGSVGAHAGLSALGPGSMIRVPSGREFHGVCYDSINYVALFLDPWFIDHSVEDVLVGPISIAPGIDNADPLAWRLLQALGACVDDPGADAMLLEAIASAFSVRIAQRHGSARTTLADKGGAIGGARLRDILDYIDANIAEDVSLQTLASLAGMSVFQMTRGFSKAMGMPPHKYVVRRRVERAMELLRGSDLAMSHIAARLGFYNQSHFSTCFSRVTGTTPLHYRRKAMSERSSVGGGTAGAKHEC